ncbi:MAG: outer membrane protein transport protein [Bacteroidetes bacterium]|nr:outer membrane protein transport protein [Bacteroidota bacterium]
MKQVFRIHWVAWVIVLFCVNEVYAGGYQIYEQGARATGMGGAFVARASDPSAIFYNVAGLGFQKGINVLAGMNLIIPSTTFKGKGIMQPLEYSTKSAVFTPINLYGSYEVMENLVVGLGVYNPFGLGTEWKELWGLSVSGAYLGSTKAIKSSIETWYFNPSIAYKVNDELSVGLGFSYVYASAYISRNILPNAVKKLELDGTGDGFSVNVGAIYKPMEKLSVGLSYRTTTTVEFEGDVKIANAYVASGKTKLPMPGFLVVGAAYELMPELTVEGDIQYTQWSEYNKLSINFNRPVAQLGGISNITEIKKWDDVLAVRVGGEYTLNQQVTLRGGLIMDISPQPPSKTEPMLPDGDRYNVTLGGSYKINNNLSIDASYMFLYFAEKDAKNSVLPGNYNSLAHIFSVNLAYSF